MKMFDLVSGALALALSGLSVAGTPDAQPATAVPIADGLYATLHAHSGSFVATNAAGKLELARRIEDVRAQARHWLVTSTPSCTKRCARSRRAATSAWNLSTPTSPASWRIGRYRQAEASVCTGH